LLTGPENSQDYFTCPEDGDRGRCSPSPERQSYAIVSKSDFEWTTLSEILDPSSSGGKQRLKGFVKYISPDLTSGSNINPLEMLRGLCTDGCSSAGRVPKLSTEISSLVPCKECKKLSEIVFHLGIKISETEITNFASTVPARWLFCSGLHAEKLLGCSAQDFYESKDVREGVAAKWADLINKPIQVSIQIISGQHDGSKEFYIIDSAIVSNN
jgi:hypothetical protein